MFDDVEGRSVVRDDDALLVSFLCISDGSKIDRVFEGISSLPLAEI